MSKTKLERIEELNERIEQIKNRQRELKQQHNYSPIFSKKGSLTVSGKTSRVSPSNAFSISEIL